MSFDELRTSIAYIKQACLPPDSALGYLSDALRQFLACTKVSLIQDSLESQGIYRRQRLSLPEDDFHIVVAIWKPNSSSPIHDHDNATGAVITLVGETIEIKYERVASLGHYSFLAPGEPQRLDAKTLAPILPGDGGCQLHSMHNPHNTWAATLHVYLHPLERFNLYHSHACDLYTQAPTELWFDEVTAPLTTQPRITLPDSMRSTIPQVA